MIEALTKLFSEQLKLTPEYWTYVLLGVIALAFFISLIVGLAAGDFVKIKKLMKTVAAKPSTSVASMKKMPAAVKNQYRRARVMNVKPSDFVTESDCVTVPYARSLASKIWLITLVATVLCAAIAYFACPLAGGSEAALLADSSASGTLAMFVAPLFLLICGGLLTFVGAIVGACSRNGALKTYAKFSRAIDGDVNVAAAPEAPHAAPAYHSEPVQPVAAEPTYAEPVSEVNDAPFVASEPIYEQQAAYVEPEPIVSPVIEPEPIVTVQPQESDEEIRRKAREEALRQAQAQQAAAQAQAQAQAAAQAQAQAAPVGSSSADDVIAQIEKINREGAPRETMREVATLLQKERAKPENKTPEQQKKLNEALSKLLKAMAASRK